MAAKSVSNKPVVAVGGKANRRAGLRLMVSVLLVGDLVAVGTAALLAVWLRTMIFGKLNYDFYIQFLLALGIFPLVYAYAGLYPAAGIGPVEQLRKLVGLTTLVSLLVVASTFLRQQGTEVSRIVFVLWWLLAVLLVPLVRSLVRALFSRCRWWGTPILVLGAARTAEQLIRKLNEHPGIGLRPVACLDDDIDKQGDSCSGVPVLGPLHAAPGIASAGGIRMAVIAMPGLTRHRLLQVIEEYTSAFPQVLIIPDLLGLTSLWVSGRDFHGMLGLEVQQNLVLGSNRFLKRTTDLLVAVPALLATSPIMLLAALAVRLNSPGPVFYAQEREGLKGKRIRVWKIRTMVQDADAVLALYLAQNPAAQAEWDSHMKLRHDPRIIGRVGHVLRRFSLDELPQLWNIVTGDMSLVGPRPFPDYHLSRFSSGFRSLRSKVTPGLTGLWQVSARSDGDLEMQEELDSYYIRNWSIWLDLYLLARTAWAVFFGNGAY